VSSGARGGRGDFYLVVRGDRQNERVIARIKGGEAATRRSIRHAFMELGRDLRATARAEILRKPKSGRTYLIYSARTGRARRHVASAPGETHANITGELRRSIGWKVHGQERMEFGYGVTAPAPRRGIFLEYGTRYMRPRPSLHNAILATQAQVQHDFEDAMNRAFNRGAQP